MRRQSNVRIAVPKQHLTFPPCQASPAHLPLQRLLRCPRLLRFLPSLKLPLPKKSAVAATISATA